MKRVAIIVAIILAVITLLVVTWQLHKIVVLFIISLAIAATARAPIDGLMKRGLPRGVATAIIFAIGFIGSLSLVYLLTIPLADEVERIAKDATGLYARFQAGWHNNQRFGPFLAARLPSAEQFAAFMAGGQTVSLATAALTTTGNLVEHISELLISIVLSMYWATDELRFERLWLSLLPAEQRVRARNAWRALEAGVGAYIRSEITQSLLAGLLLGLGFHWLGLHYPVMWALFAALAWLIPLVGALIAVIPLWVIAAVNVTPFVATSAVVYTLVVLACMEFFIEPRLYTRDRYAKVLVLIVILTLVDAFGLIGLLVAPVVATAIQIGLNELVAPTAPVSAPTAQTLDVSALQARLTEVQELVEPLATPAGRRIENMSARLATLLEKAQIVENEA